MPVEPGLMVTRRSRGGTAFGVVDGLPDRENREVGRGSNPGCPQQGAAGSVASASPARWNVAEENLRRALRPEAEDCDFGRHPATGRE